MKKLLLIFCSFSTSLAVGQQSIAVRAGAAMRAPIEVKFLGFGIPESDDLELMPQWSHQVSRNESTDNSALEVLKKDKMLEKEKALASTQYSEKNQEVQGKKIRSLVPSFVVGYNALGNQGTPSDNTIAINTLDQIICSVNSSLRIYNAANGAALASTQSLSGFFSTPQNGSLLTNSLCDPKVIFDPQAKRFIVFAQTCDGNSSTSQILLAFSKAENPLQGWYFYTFTGNPSSSIGQNVWFDYPKIGVSDADVFVTGNMFSNAPNYVQSVIYQVNKTKCYAGNTLNNGDAILWYDIDNSPFTMVPMTNGQLGGYGNNMYLAATGSSWSGPVIKMYEITNSTSNNPSILASLVPTDTASPPADAIQNGTSVDLDVADNRGMDGFYLNGTVHYVFHADVGQGFAGINYSRLTKNGSNWTLKRRIIRIPNKDIAFPSIASIGWTSTDQSAIIGFNYASSSDYPGMKAVYVDHDFRASAPIEIRTGTGYASVIPQNGVTRWGDYSGMTRVHNASKPTAWQFGMYGNTFNQWTNYFAKITTNGWPLETEDITIDTPSEVVNVYPNPVVDDIFHTTIVLQESGNIQVDLLDLKGSLIRKVYKGYGTKGENLFTFYKAALATGDYILQIKLNNNKVINEKVSVRN